MHNNLHIILIMNVIHYPLNLKVKTILFKTDFFFNFLD